MRHRPSVKVLISSLFGDLLKPPHPPSDEISAHCKAHLLAMCPFVQCEEGGEKRRLEKVLHRRRERLLKTEYVRK